MYFLHNGSRALTCTGDRPSVFLFLCVVSAGKECIERRLTALQSGLCVWGSCTWTQRGVGLNWTSRVCATAHRSSQVLDGDVKLVDMKHLCCERMWEKKFTNTCRSDYCQVFTYSTSLNTDSFVGQILMLQICNRWFCIWSAAGGKEPYRLHVCRQSGCWWRWPSIILFILFFVFLVLSHFHSLAEGKSKRYSWWSTAQHYLKNKTKKLLPKKYILCVC